MTGLTGGQPPTVSTRVARTNLVQPEKPNTGTGKGRGKSKNNQQSPKGAARGRKGGRAAARAGDQKANKLGFKCFRCGGSHPSSECKLHGQKRVRNDADDMDTGNLVFTAVADDGEFILQRNYRTALPGTVQREFSEEFRNMDIRQSKFQDKVCEHVKEDDPEAPCLEEVGGTCPVCNKTSCDLHYPIHAGRCVEENLGREQMKMKISGCATAVNLRNHPLRQCWSPTESKH